MIGKLQVRTSVKKYGKRGVAEILVSTEEGRIGVSKDLCGVDRSGHWLICMHWPIKGWAERDQLCRV